MTHPCDTVIRHAKYIYTFSYDASAAASPLPQPNATTCLGFTREAARVDTYFSRSGRGHSHSIT
ncbi:MAG: hypothetical protein F2732_06765 [Actinobacteria bacterium]|nr:hypothetical protein [Actinomycetota bacterium]